MNRDRNPLPFGKFCRFGFELDILPVTAVGHLEAVVHDHVLLDHPQPGRLVLGALEILVVLDIRAAAVETGLLDALDVRSGDGGGQVDLEDVPGTLDGGARADQDRVTELRRENGGLQRETVRLEDRQAGGDVEGAQRRAAGELAKCSFELMRRAKRMGFSDPQIAWALGCTEEEVRTSAQATRCRCLSRSNQ